MLQDLLASIGVVINGLPQGLLALSYGFAAKPTAIGFMIGAIGALFFGLVAPISFQAETITLAGKMGRNREERLSIIVLAGITMTVIGCFGLLEKIISFIGPAISNGMMAGVGIILALVAMDMVKSNKIVGMVSIIVAFLTQAYTGNLVYTIVVSVVTSSLIAQKTGFEITKSLNMEDEKKLKLFPIVYKNVQVIRGTLALVCLTVGANIVFGNITGSIANSSVNIDHLTIVSGLADTFSGLFGGGPVESIISATGAAPHPMYSAVIMMLIMAAILFSGLLPKIGRKVPIESIAGFLLVLGAVVTVPINMKLAVEANPIIGGVTAVVTAATDPFTGMVAGVLVRILLGLTSGLS